MHFSTLKMKKKMASEGVRYTDVADQADCNISTVNSQLNNKRDLSAKLVAAVVELTGSSADEFIVQGDEDETCNEPARVRRLRPIHLPNTR